ncbi:putative immunity protein [Herbiconiux liukaitaii]|uniref:putative immunity protein n=1 Tax=Herbiconiux liukaitaii TaxID=3342799 RepID=UPI0035B8BC93
MSGETKVRWANPEPPIHRAIALWAARCAERVLPIFEEQRPGDERPRAAIAALRAWERGELPMTACRTAAFAAHAAARDATEAGSTAAAVAAARAAGQACAVAHMFDHSPHAAAYAAKAIGLDGGGEVAREAERAWQWENLAPELRSIGFPKG